MNPAIRTSTWTSTYMATRFIQKAHEPTEAVQEVPPEAIIPALVAIGLVGSIILLVVGFAELRIAKFKYMKIMY